MAFSAVTERGSATNKSVGGTTIAVSPTANLTVGKIVFAYGVVDNTATASGASTNHTSVTDTDGHTWNKVFERTMSSGVAADGVTHSLWWTKVATQIDTTDSITLTIGTGRTAKALLIFEVTITASTIQVADDGTAFAFQEANTSAPSVSTSGMTSQEYLHIGCMAVEEEVTTWNEDASYTNVFAAEGITSGPAGGNDTNVVGFLGSRIATLTGDTFNPTFAAARDMAVAVVAFEEVTGGVTLSGTLFTKAPTFPTGVVTPGAVTLSGSLFTKAPTFPQGVVSLVSGPQTLNGVLFTKAPTFFTGTLAATYQLTGTLFSKAPTFPVGTVTPVYSLAGVLFVKAPTFPSGTLSTVYSLAGVLFQKAPTFPVGTVTPGTVTLSGVLFQKAPTFNAGVLQQQGGPQLLGGTLFVKTPTFPTGVVTPGAVSIAGVLFQKAPTFPQGSVVVVLTGTLYQNAPTFPQGAVIPDQPLTGTLFQKSPSFFVGTLGVAGALTGILFTNAPVFFTGTLAQGAASFWQPNPVAYTLNPVAYVPVGAGGPSPWGATLSGEPFEKAPLFPVGAVT